MAKSNGCRPRSEKAEADTKPIDLKDFKSLIPDTKSGGAPKHDPVRVGDPARWLRFVGVLTHEESEAILAAVNDFERVEE